MLACFADSSEDALPLVPLRTTELKGWLAGRSDITRQWVEAKGFAAEAGSVCAVPGRAGGMSGFLVGLGGAADPIYGDLWSWAGAADALPAGTYRIEGAVDGRAATRAALAWALAAYRFDRYRSRPKEPGAVLCWPEKADAAAVRRAAGAVWMVRDLINTPAADMGPAELAEAARAVAAPHGARVREVVGQDLLSANYPAIHAVGRASVNAPRLIDLAWGPEDAPKVTLVGKGVCFDTGGLGLKPADSMKLMKKDMGGAALVLGLARMIMDAGLKVRLRVLIPAVENSVSGNALRPLDVVRTRKGATVEIGHTDAEGRVILADALAEASAEQPDLLIDCATLTGAARVALGTELPALFCNDERLAADILGKATEEGDPLWRLPLWPGYRRMIDGRTADLTNDAEGRFGGAITAALFLQEFVGDGIAWAHVDLMAWNPAGRPGRPEGGEAQTLRALFALIAERYAKPE